jgi:hypothetical protein
MYGQKPESFNESPYLSTEARKLQGFKTLTAIGPAANAHEFIVSRRSFATPSN